jgi:DNA-binding IclR family transcriptional regulator
MAQGSQTADRAISLLFHAVSSEEPIGLAELGRRSGLNKAATYRLIQSLQNHGLLTREPDGHRYVVGPGLVAMAAMVMRKLEIRVAGRPVLERLAAATLETISLHMRCEDRRICIDTLESKYAIRRVVPMGETLPLYAGPSGKAILAHLPPSELEVVLDHARAAGEDLAVIGQQLEACRVQGFLGLVGDRTPGVGGLCAPVFDSTGVVGVITVSGPTERFNAEAIAGVTELVVRETGLLSAALGHTAQPPV